MPRLGDRAAVRIERDEIGFLAGREVAELVVDVEAFGAAKVIDQKPR